MTTHPTPSPTLASPLANHTAPLAPPSPPYPGPAADVEPDYPPVWMLPTYEEVCGYVFPVESIPPTLRGKVRFYSKKVGRKVIERIME
ncbi:hypothetical protein JCM10207_001678 [Rhodosporidiobolus poonsookiae]